MTPREAFVHTVIGYVDTPYVHQGRLPSVGMDCPAPLICASWENGLKPRSWDVTGYQRTPDGSTLQALCEEHMQRIAMDEALPGDAILVRFQQGHPQHLGVLTDATPNHRWWVEAESQKYKRVIHARLMFNRHTVLVGAYRVPGL